jgi:hypothetical protein
MSARTLKTALLANHERDTASYEESSITNTVFMASPVVPDSGKLSELVHWRANTRYEKIQLLSDRAQPCGL